MVALLVAATVGGAASVVAQDESTDATETGAEAFAVVPEGMHVEAPVEDERAAERHLAAELGVDRRDVRVAAPAGVVEVLVADVTRTEFVAALETIGVYVEESEVRDRPSEGTMAAFERVLERRFEAVDYGGEVTARRDALLVEPARNGARVRELATVRGAEVWAAAPRGDGHGVERVVTAEDVSHVGEARAAERGEGGYVPVGLSHAAAEAFAASMRELDFDREGGTACRYDRERSLEGNLREMDDDRCLLTVVGEEVVFASGVGPGLAEAFRTGEFTVDPALRVGTATEAEAETVELLLRSGPLPAEVSLASPDAVTSGEGGDADDTAGIGAGFGPLAALTAGIAAVAASLAARSHSGP